MKRLSDLEREKYEKVWTHDVYRGNAPGEKRVRMAIEQLDLEPGKQKIVDFGCGTGRAAAAFQALGFDIIGVDHAANCLDEGIEIPFLQTCLWDIGTRLGDVGFCTDVMEHIPPTMIVEALASIHTAAPEKAFFQICLRPDGCGPRLLGEPLHLTVREPGYWTRSLAMLWERVDVLRNDGRDIIVACQ